jgi:hypothetical protein
MSFSPTNPPSLSNVGNVLYLSNNITKVSSNLTIGTSPNATEQFYFLGNANVTANLAVQGNLLVRRDANMVGNVVILNGNLGIGRTNPQYALDIAGTANISNNLLVAGSANVSGSANVVGNLVALSNVLISNGNLGIGTADPRYKLDVAGDANISGNLIVGGIANITGNINISNLNVVTANVSESAGIGGSLYVVGGANVGGSANLLGSVFMGAGANVTGNLVVGGNVTIVKDTFLSNLYTANANVSDILSANCVQIGGSGTSEAIGRRLTVTNADTTDTTVNGSVNGNVYNIVSYGASRSWVWSADAVDNRILYLGAVGGDATNPDFNYVFKRDVGFQIQPFTPGNTTDFIETLKVVGNANIVGNLIGFANLLVPNGNVGIGTLLASSNLTVVGSANVGNTDFQFCISKLLDVGGKGCRVTGIDATGNTLIQADQRGVGWRNIVLNGQGGNVGIGTLDPQYKLDVAGSANISGNLIIGGNTTISGNINLSNLNVVTANVTGNATVGNLTVTGIANVMGNMILGSNLDITGGNANVVGNVIVTGANNYFQVVGSRAARLVSGSNVIYLQTGANTTDGTSADFFIGDFNMATGTSVRKFMIRANGNVGIGLERPEYPLDVVGAANISSSLYVASQSVSVTGSTSVGNIQIRSQTGNTTVQQILNFNTHNRQRGGGILWSGPDGNIQQFFGRAYIGGFNTDGLYYNATSTGADVLSSGATTTKLQILDNGNVILPSGSKLTVGTSTVNGAFDANIAGNTLLNMVSYTGNITYATRSDGPLYPAVGSIRTLVLPHSTNNGLIGPNYPNPECMMMMSNDTSGNLFGWGMYAGVVKDLASTNPFNSIRLDFGSTQNISTNSNNAGANTITPRVTVRFSGNAGTMGINRTNPLYDLDVAGAANISGNLMVDTNTLFVDSVNGRVGVGTTTPGSTFYVAGNARVTANLYVGPDLPFNLQPGIPLFVRNTSVIDSNINGSLSGNVYNQIAFGGRNWTFAQDTSNDNTLFLGCQGGGDPDPDFEYYFKRSVGLQIQPNPSVITTDFTEALKVLGNANITGNVNIGNSNALFVDTVSGRVGIRKTNPAYTFDVTGNINFTGNLFQNGNLFSSGQWTTSGSNIYYNVANGNVGIGTTTPLYKLDVAGSANVSSNIYCTNMFVINDCLVQGGDFSIMNGNLTVYERFNAFGESVLNGNLTIYNSDIYNYGNSYIYNGLYVNKNGALYTNNETAGQHAIYAYDTANLMTTLYGGADDTNKVGYLSAGGYGGGLPLLLNPNGGNVGVGTGSPTATLDVNGTFTANQYIANYDSGWFAVAASTSYSKSLGFTVDLTRPPTFKVLYSTTATGIIGDGTGTTNVVADITSQGINSNGSYAIRYSSSSSIIVRTNTSVAGYFNGSTGVQPTSGYYRLFAY